MSAEIARDVAAHQPISGSAQELILSMQVSPGYLEQRITSQQNIVRANLEMLDVVVSMSTPQAMDFDPFVHVEDEAPSALSGFAEHYDRVRRDPVAKHDFDSQLIQSCLSRLGPTNHLRRKDGMDAAFELATMSHLLEADFQMLPVHERLPERRFAEALIAEELALLWAPTIPQKAQRLPDERKGLIYNADDPNVLDPEQMATLSEKDKWKVIGAKLSSEAANLFRAIAESPTAEPEIRLEARTRDTDMSVRRLSILAGMERDKAKRQQLRDRSIKLCTDDLDLAVKAWRTPQTRAQIKQGKLFEFMAVAKIRYEAIASGDPTHMVRMALPREDRIDMQPIVNRNDEDINLSVDIVVEDSNGNFVKAYQVKAMTEAEYEKHMAKRQTEEGKNRVVYPERRADMIFLDEMGAGELVSSERR